MYLIKKLRCETQVGKEDRHASKDLINDILAISNNISYIVQHFNNMKFKIINTVIGESTERESNYKIGKVVTDTFELVEIKLSNGDIVKLRDDWRKGTEFAILWNRTTLLKKTSFGKLQYPDIVLKEWTPFKLHTKIYVKDIKDGCATFVKQKH